MENSFTKKFQRRKNNFTKNQEEEERRPPQNFKIGKKNLLPLLTFYPYDFSGTG